jgi:hypothetical protein
MLWQEQKGRKREENFKVLLVYSRVEEEWPVGCTYATP